MLDGFPTRATQAEVLTAAGAVPTLVLALAVPEAEVVARCAPRRFNPETGAEYHLVAAPPPDDAALRARLEQRAEDCEDAIARRSARHRKTSAAVAEHYAARTRAVDGAAPEGAVTAACLAALDAALEAARAARSRAESAAGGPAGSAAGGFAARMTLETSASLLQTPRTATATRTFQAAEEQLRALQSSIARIVELSGSESKTPSSAGVAVECGDPLIGVQDALRVISSQAAVA